MQHFFAPFLILARSPRTAALLPAMLLLVLLAGGCQPVSAPDAASETGVVSSAGDWETIRARGQLVAGTAADYPPFEYYDANFRLRGYDVALLRAIGGLLGVEVIFKDFALEGLEGALALGQIDVATAALTVTPARATVLDFTQPYFASTEGILGPPGSTRTIATAGDLEGQRIGVERGSIYAQWLREELVAAGPAAESDLILYTVIEDAAADLAAGRIDLVVTDLPVARDLALTEGLTLVGSGLRAEQYALAVGPDADALRAELDQALATLAENGTLARIAAEELGLRADELMPRGDLPDFTAETAEETAEAVNGEPVERADDAAGCIDGLASVADLTLPDLGMTAPAVMAPGQSFTKSWRVLNSGTCPWDNTYQLVFAHGSPAGASMGAQAVAVRGAVAPGATYDLEAQLIAGVSPGVYQGAWQMQNGAGTAFGERLRVGIQVAGVPTPTPGPTQTPAPGIAFSASAERLVQGSAVELRWDVPGAAEVYFYRAGQEWQGRAVAPTGSATDIPNATTTYHLRVVRDGGEVIRQVTVYVEPNPELPQVAYFTPAPGGTVALGQCISLAWRIDGAVEQVALFRNNEPLWEEAPVEGVYTDCPETAGTYEYAVGAQGPGGRNYAVATVTVAAAAEAPKAASPEGPVIGPVIDTFAVLPVQVTLGECVALRWVVAGDARSIRIMRDGVVLVEGAPNSGSGSDCPTAPGTVRYEMAAADAEGRTATAEAAVEARAPVPTATPAPAAADTAPGTAPDTAPLAAPLAAPAATLAPDPLATPVGVPDASPVGREYVLISYRAEGGQLASPLTGTRVTAHFEAGGTLRGEGGCNTYHSTYTIGDGTLAIAPLAATEKFCAEPIGIMDQEQHYLSALQTAAAFTLEGGMLTLLDGAGNPVAVFVPAQ